MNERASHKSTSSTQVKVGVFTKKEAAHFVSQDICHIHSTPLGTKDPAYKVTNEKLTGKDSIYQWELGNQSSDIILNDSSQQSHLIKKLMTETQFSKTTQNRDRLQLTLTELLSNGFYHAFTNEDGTDKYDRLKKAVLSENERLVLNYTETPQGIFLSLLDNGGNLTLSELKSRLERSYLMGHNPVLESKHQGAGIGFFLIFEMATHLCLSVNPKKETRISIWLSQNTSFKSDFFSFNFFEG
jgi:hypothetical protein